MELWINESCNISTTPKQFRKLLRRLYNSEPTLYQRELTLVLHWPNVRYFKCWHYHVGPTLNRCSKMMIRRWPNVNPTVGSTIPRWATLHWPNVECQRWSNIADVIGPTLGQHTLAFWESTAPRLRSQYLSGKLRDILVKRLWKERHFTAIFFKNLPNSGIHNQTL